jgi:Lrp/AsnC family leucine-responsive transcriptional regulator
MTLTDPERKILRVLQTEGRITNVELSRRVGMSETPCLRKLKQLEDAGVVTGYHATIDQKAVGLPVSAFVLVNTDQRTETDRRLFNDAVANEPQIIACAALSGAYDFILEVVAKDIDDLADLTMRRLLSLPTVADLSSSIVYHWTKRGEPLPV